MANHRGLGARTAGHGRLYPPARPQGDRRVEGRVEAPKRGRRSYQLGERRYGQAVREPARGAWEAAVISAVRHISSFFRRGPSVELVESRLKSEHTEERVALTKKMLDDPNSLTRMDIAKLIDEAWGPK